ncbi:MAG: SRPBCC family protein [Deltaproteobacteria bacterium]|nr:SRPBCC family protein [Deltaproteobacteria bacterium]
MITYDNSIVIKAPVSEVFTYVNDLTTMADWLTGLVEVRNVIGAGEGQQCEWTFKLIGIQLRGQAVVVDCVENKRCTHQSIGMFSATWKQIVEPHEDGTKLIIEVEYTLPLSVLGKLAEPLTVRRMARDLDSSLLNIKEALES